MSYAASPDPSPQAALTPATRTLGPALRFLALVAELGLVLALVHRFDLERDRGLLALTPLVFGGFLVHAVLPRGLRLPFFLALSLAGFGVVFGPAAGAGLVGAGLALIGLCHLPVPWSLRFTLLFAAGAALTALRADWLRPSWAPAAGAVLPVLGSIFMFRLVLYVYELRTENPRLSLWQRLAYFFLLPNALFPLFPIIDFKAFRRTWYQREAHAIYAKGIRWMGRGVTHLLLYRVIYQNFTPDVSAVSDLGGVVLSVVSSYALYLRVSGLFHLVIGMLGLFGFDLPETHHHYFLASGFNDLWRRINIYWKDFMMKIVYYPIFVRLRRRGPTRALVVATVAVFMISWWLHSYQWFWIRGSFPLTVVDAIFWTLFAVTVLVNSLLQARSGARARRGSRRPTPRAALVHALKVVGMFGFMCLLWSFWTGGRIDTWLRLMGAAGNSPPAHFAWLAAGLAGAVAVGTLWQLFVQPALATWRKGLGFPAAWAGNVALLLALLALGTPSLTGLHDDPLVASLRADRLNEHDEALMLRGYYEEILENDRALGGLWDRQGGKPAHWVRLSETDALQRVPELLYDCELRPDLDFEFCEARLRTNRWGLRDRDYSLAKPPGTHRVALLGASIEMGSGVEDDEVFEAVVEAALAADAPAGAPPVELINFAVAGYSTLSQVDVLARRALAFEPDVVLLMAHTVDPRLVLRHLARAEREGRLAHQPQLAAILELEGIDPAIEETPANKQAVWKAQRRVTAWAYQRIVSLCRHRGIEPVWVYLQHPPDPSPGQVQRGEQLLNLATLAGFTTVVLDGDRVYPADRLEHLQLRPWDNHPSPEGHARIADELLRQLLARPELLGRDAAASPPR